MHRRELPLLFAIFLDLVGFGITFPDVQLRAQEYGVPGWQIGAILSSYYLVQMLVSPLWGQCSDRVGRKPVLLLCGVISAASMVCYALAQNSLWLLAARLLAGVGAANVAAAQAYIADTIEPEERPAALARMSAAVSAGLVSGPVLGGILAGAGGNFLLGIVAAIASAIGAVWILIAVPSRPPTTPETTTPETTTPETTTPENKVVKASTPTSVRLLQIVPELRSLLLVATIGWFALACLEGTFGRLIQRTLELGRLEFGFLLSVEAGVSVVQGIFFPLLARHHSYRTLLRTSYIFQAIGLCLMPFASHFVWLVLLSILFGIGLGIAGPAINGEASTQSPATRQGEVFGLLQATRAFGFLFGPILGGALFDWHIASPYLIAGGMLLGIVFFVGRGKPDTPH